jgi:hypothetical protein
MIQFNLLPDVKLAYIKSQRTKKTVITSSIISIVVALGVLLLLILAVYVYQSLSLKSTTDEITKLSSQLTNTDDLNKMLTVQNQLKSLTGLHDQKQDAKRVPEIINQLTPTQVTISDMIVNYEESKMTINGAAPSLDLVNKFVDTLKFTDYKSDTMSEEARAFKDVVLTSFGRQDDEATFSIQLSFDPGLFAINQNAQLTVPTLTTTRSVLGQSTLFEANEEDQN